VGNPVIGLVIVLIAHVLVVVLDTSITVIPVVVLGLVLVLIQGIRDPDPVRALVLIPIVVIPIIILMVHLDIPDITGDLLLIPNPLIVHHLVLIRDIIPQDVLEVLIRVHLLRALNDPVHPLKILTLVASLVVTKALLQAAVAV